MSLDVASAIVKLNSLTARFDNSVRAARTVIGDLATLVDSEGDSEEYGILGAVPAVREWLGDRKFATLRAAKWALYNKLWEGSVSIEKMDALNDKLGFYGATLEQMGRRAVRHPDTLLFTLVNAGTTGLCFDGKAFFATDHTWGKSGTQSNSLTHDVTSPTAPTAAELKAAYNVALTALASLKDDEGELLNDPIFDDAMQLVYVCHPSIRQAAEDALTVQTVSTGGQNLVLVRPRIITTPLYTSTSSFVVLKVDEPLKPFIWQTRLPLQREMSGWGTIEYKQIKFMTQAAYNVGYGAWWTAMLVTLT